MLGRIGVWGNPPYPDESPGLGCSKESDEIRQIAWPSCGNCEAASVSRSRMRQAGGLNAVMSIVAPLRNVAATMLIPSATGMPRK